MMNKQYWKDLVNFNLLKEDWREVRIFEKQGKNNYCLDCKTKIDAFAQRNKRIEQKLIFVFLLAFAIFIIAKIVL